jgi:hypothetical protein
VHVGSAFLVVTAGLFDGTKSVRLVEAPCPNVALKRPEVEAFGMEAFGKSKEL